MIDSRTGQPCSIPSDTCRLVVKIIVEKYGYGPSSDIKFYYKDQVLTIPCEGFPTEESARDAIAGGFAVEYKPGEDIVLG